MQTPSAKDISRLISVTPQRCFFCANCYEVLVSVPLLFFQLQQEKEEQTEEPRWKTSLQVDCYHSHLSCVIVYAKGYNHLCEIVPYKLQICLKTIELNGTMNNDVMQFM
jgi:hypothetical protein